MQANSKPLPPFGAILQQYQLSRIKLNYSVYIFVGKHAWREANKMIASQVCLCLPVDNPVDMYLWPVKGLSLVLFDTSVIGDAALYKIAAHLLDQEARRICIFTNDMVTDIFHLYK